MRNTIVVAAMLGGLGVAGAQAQADGEGGTYLLGGCYVQEKQVTCDVMYTLTKSDKSDIVFRRTTVFTVDGQNLGPKSVNLGGDNFLGGPGYNWPNATLYKNIPVKISIRTGLPSNTTMVRALILESGNVRFDNIPVRGGASPSPAPVATPTPVNTGNYNAVLTGCKQGANATLTCTATLTPRR